MGKSGVHDRMRDVLRWRKRHGAARATLDATPLQCTPVVVHDCLGVAVGLEERVDLRGKKWMEGMSRIDLHPTWGGRVLQPRLAHLQDLVLE